MKSRKHQRRSDDGVPIRTAQRNNNSIYWAVAFCVCFVALLILIGGILIAKTKTQQPILTQSTSNPASSGSEINDTGKRKSAPPTNNENLPPNLPTKPSGIDLASSDNETVGDLVAHFKKSGLQGFYQQTPRLPKGAKECGVFVWGEEINVEITCYEDASLAKSLELSSGFGNMYYRHGRLVIRIGRGHDKVLPIFNKFQS